MSGSSTAIWAFTNCWLPDDWAPAQEAADGAYLTDPTDYEMVRMVAEVVETRTFTPPELDLSDCPYFKGTGACVHGCRDEPSCRTDRPADGWPSERATTEPTTGGTTNG